MVRYAESFHPAAGKQWALDFGCGVGRLTRALAAHFDRVTGVDISPAMIEHAREHPSPGLEYVVNEAADLRRFADAQFDFVYSSITLQHMPPRFARNYIAEFLRVLKPGGILLFQLPSHRTGKLARARSLAHEIFEPLLHPIAPRVVMRGIPKLEVVQLLIENGADVLDVAPDQSAGPSWESFRYLARR